MWCKNNEIGKNFIFKKLKTDFSLIKLLTNSDLLIMKIDANYFLSPD